MWNTLCWLHLKRTEENVISLHAKIFDYRMSTYDDICFDTQSITSMALVSSDLEQAFTGSAIVEKIISNLPSSFNRINAAWSNVNKENKHQITWKSVYSIMRRYSWLEETRTEGSSTKSFNTRASTSKLDWRHKSSWQEQHRKDVEYLKDLKRRSKCLRCG